MSRTSFALLSIVLVFQVQGQEVDYVSRFSQFHQSDYGIVHDRVVVEYYNKSIVDNVVAYTFRYNRTTLTKAFNASADVLIDLQDKVVVETATFKLASNEYRAFPVNFAVNYCQEYKRNTFGVQSILKRYSNLKSCPVKKGHYYAYNYMLEEDKFPPYIPGGSYKLTWKFYAGDLYAARVSWYGSVVPKEKLRWER